MVEEMIHQYGIFRQITRLLNLTSSDFPPTMMDFSNKPDVAEDLFETRHDTLEELFAHPKEVLKIGLESQFKVQSFGEKAFTMLTTDPNLNEDHTVKALFLASTLKMKQSNGTVDTRAAFRGQSDIKAVTLRILEGFPSIMSALFNSLPSQNPHLRLLFARDLKSSLSQPVLNMMCDFKILESCETDSNAIYHYAFTGTNATKVSYLIRKLVHSSHYFSDPRVAQLWKTDQATLLGNVTLSNVSEAIFEDDITLSETLFLLDVIGALDLSPGDLGLISPKLVEEDPLVRSLFPKFYVKRLEEMKRYVVVLDRMVDHLANVMQTKGITNYQGRRLKGVWDKLEANNKVAQIQEVGCYV